MRHAIFFPVAIALGLITAPAAAQSSYPPPPPPDRDQSMMNQDNSMHRPGMHHEGRDRMSMDRRHSDWRTMRWCRSMGYRRMMRNPRCRWLMGHADRMHHR